MDSGIGIVEVADYASSCKVSRNQIKNEGKLPWIPNDIQDAMSNGSGDGSNGDNVHGEDGFHISCDFFEPVANENELEVKDEGGVVLTEIDEGDDVFLFLEEVLEIDGGGGEGSRVEGWHYEWGSWFQRKLVGLVVSV